MEGAQRHSTGNQGIADKVSGVRRLLTSLTHWKPQLSTALTVVKGKEERKCKELCDPTSKDVTDRYTETGSLQPQARRATHTLSIERGRRGKKTPLCSYRQHSGSP